ncbi:MAG: glycosyltransferase family 4 protein [Fibrobacterota bacterium]
MKKRILIVNWRDIKNPEAGGAEVHLHEIFNRFDPARFDITLIASEYPNGPAEEQVGNIRVLRRGGRELFNFWVYANIRRYARRLGADLVVDDVNKIPFFLPRLLDRPVLAFFHHLFDRTIYNEFSLLPATYVYLSEKLIGAGYRNAPFTAVSPSTMGELRAKGLDGAKGKIVYNGIDLARYTPGGPKEPFHLLFLGRIKKYKNPGFLLLAAERLKQEFPALRLTIAGGGDYLPELKKQAQHLDYVRFTGVISEETKIELYRKAALFVNPSIKEGWSITNIEASACGTPVVASDAPGLRDSVKPGVNGFLFEYGNLDAFCDAVRRVLSNAGEAARLSAGARAFAENYSWDASAAAMQQIVEGLL